MKKQIFFFLLVSSLIGVTVLAQSKKGVKKTNPAVGVKDTNGGVSRPFVTFIELGSVNCIPCKAMQPIMKSVEEKYGDQVKVIFYDVWKKEQAHFGKEYNIRLIPTQVFLDKSGKELMRHEGFFPKNEIDAFLQSKGLKAKTGVEG